MKLFKRILGVVFTGAVIVTLLLTWTNRQDIYDWWRLRNYTPPTTVAALADATTMTPSARRLFYVNRPVVAQASDFNAACSQEASIVLGCYISSKGIYLYNVTDPRLNGVKEVTAAHEMLHAAYERLSLSERQRIDTLTQSVFANLKNERIKANVEKYRQQDPNVVPNELHSILATEVKDLPPELETYYSKYFTNRKAIVVFSDQYESEFTKRQDQVATYDQQLSDLKLEIDGNKNELTVQYKALTVSREELDNLLNAGNVAEYNKSVPSFNQQVNQYNATVKTTDQMINKYNTLVEQRNSIAVEVRDLAQAIDSRPQSF